jgi:hypothetical protein
MKIYQPQKNNPYKLPHNLYMQMVYLLRDYDRQIRELEELRYNIAHERPEIEEGMPRGCGTSNPTQKKAFKIIAMSEELTDRCKAVEQALIEIPSEYRSGVMNNICYGCAYPYDAHYNTYRNWRRRLLYKIAENLLLI